MQTNAMVTKSALFVLLLTLGVAEIAAQSGALAIYGDLNFNVTSKTDDYVLQNKRQYLTIIKSLTDELEAYKSNYAKQLETINTQTVLLETNLLNIEQRLVPLEMLNDLTKYCVQKYKVRLTSVATVKSRITSCTSTAQSSYLSIVSSATSTITNMNTYISNTFKTAIDNCAKLHAKSPSNYTLCITKEISNADANMNSYRNTFNTNMQTGTCSGDGRVKQAVECSFTNVFSSIYNSGEVMYSINNCIEGKEFCPPCAVPTNPTPISSCPNVVNMQLSPVIYTNATIVNPFLGWSTNSTNCVEVRLSANLPS